MRRAVAMAMMAVLSACGPSAPSSPKPVIKVQGDAQKQLAAASEFNRTIGLKRAIYDSGNICKRVIGTRFLADYKNMATWQADCDEGHSWAIFVAPDDSAQVRPCGDEQQFKLPLCTAPTVDKDAHKKTAGTKPAA